MDDEKSMRPARAAFPQCSFNPSSAKPSNSVDGDICNAIHLHRSPTRAAVHHELHGKEPQNQPTMHAEVLKVETSAAAARLALHKSEPVTRQNWKGRLSCMVNRRAVPAASLTYGAGAQSLQMTMDHRLVGLA
jgi:hypothetical protein